MSIDTLNTSIGDEARDHRFFVGAHWIWDDDDIHPRNGWFLFRKEFLAKREEFDKALLTICADSKYVVWLNGTRLGQGPIRSWPDQLFPDSYPLNAAGKEGTNLLEVLVNHYGLGTCSYIEGPAGLIAEIDLDDGSGHARMIPTDATWQVASHPSYVRTVPKMANGLSWSEVYRADLAALKPLWKWRSAAIKSGPVYDSRAFIAKDILPLSDEPFWPVSIPSWRRVRRRGFVVSVNLRWLAFPSQLDLNKHKMFRGFIGFGIFAKESTYFELAIVNDPHDSLPLSLKLNGTKTEVVNGAFMRLKLNKGYNWALLDVSGMFHDPEFHFVFDLPKSCSLVSLSELPSDFDFPNFHDSMQELNTSSVADSPDQAQDRANTLEIQETVEQRIRNRLCFLGPYGSLSLAQIGYPIDLELPADSRYDRLANAKTFKEIEPFLKDSIPLDDEYLSPHHVALDSYYQVPIEDLVVPSRLFEVCRPANDDQASKGVDIWVEHDDSEITLDFGKELSGYLEFEVQAQQGTVIDFFCYESQHDGIVEHTFSLNNSLRYVCSQGRQKYRSPVRRGFRYCKMTVRSTGTPVLLYQVRVVLSTYPVTRRGEFRSSDYLLNRIWEICRHTVQLCMEDTFVDCPAYEQTFWTGDSYTSSLFSYYLFGNYEFPAHGNRLAVRSLERSPLIESTIPSAWQNVIPNWSFLWVLACIEHYRFSGDEATFQSLYPALVRTIRNAMTFVQKEGAFAGLFVIDAWNFIDWAPLDSPNSGAVAHQNAILVWAMQELSEISRVTGHVKEAEELTAYVTWMRKAIDGAFWSHERGAYIDSIHADGTRSEHFSVHSQLFMYLAGCGSGARRKTLLQYLTCSPKDFTDIASPFVRLFYYRALLDDDNTDDDTNRSNNSQILSSIRTIWGNMLRHDATTCWEGWNFIPGHYTRSHCHAWSSSPAFIIGAYVVGVRPLEPGFRTALLQPFFDTLEWFDGVVPTPLGDIRVEMEKEAEETYHLSVAAPKQISLMYRNPKGKWHADCKEGIPLAPQKTEGALNYYLITIKRDIVGQTTLSS